MIGVELVKLLRRPRTWISVVLTCALPFVVAVFVAITHLTPPPGQGSAFLSAVLQDGALYPAAALARGVASVKRGEPYMIDVITEPR